MDALTPAEAVAAQILDTLTPVEVAAITAQARIHDDMQNAAALMRERIDNGDMEDG